MRMVFFWGFVLILVLAGYFFLKQDVEIVMPEEIVLRDIDLESVGEILNINPEAVFNIVSFDLDIESAKKEALALKDKLISMGIVESQIKINLTNISEFKEKYIFVE